MTQDLKAMQAESWFVKKNVTKIEKTHWNTPETICVRKEKVKKY